MSDFSFLDRQIHSCVFDRRFSKLAEVSESKLRQDESESSDDFSDDEEERSKETDGFMRSRNKKMGKDKENRPDNNQVGQIREMQKLCTADCWCYPPSDGCPLSLFTAS